ncbi:MAG: TetR/AcrR family transcriptional regulator [Actinobacteria bacterium]|nr:MAG: TetR/AcrR family transcriptional regulator [Actinomycetota bacterium]
MAEGLRERKKRRTRQHIADTAARLFGERGYEQVAVVDVAEAADVSEQTVYNYFPTKQDLVFDLEEDLTQRLTELIRTRQPGVSPAAAIRDAALAFVDGIKAVPDDQARGGLDYLSAISPTVRRLSLELTDRLADAIAAAITETTEGVDPEVGKVQGIALAWVIQTITDESGRRRVAGRRSIRIARELRPVIERIIDSLDEWLSSNTRSAQPHRRVTG